MFQFLPWQNQTKIHRNVGWNHVNPHQNIAPEHSQKPPTPHQTLPATFARDALANTALTGKMLSHNQKKTNAFQPKSKISLHKSKVAKVITGVENHWRMRFFKKHVNKSSKRKLQIGEFRPVPQSHGRIFPRLNDNGSRRAPWHSGVHRHPHQPKPTFWLMAVHVSERPNCCFWILVWYYSHPCEWIFLNIILNFWVCTYRYPPFSFCWFACRKSITCD